jgi:hypothetical protein
MLEMNERHEILRRLDEMQHTSLEVKQMLEVWHAAKGTYDAMKFFARIALWFSAIATFFAAIWWGNRK